MKKGLLLFMFAIVYLSANAQFNTPTINGTVAAGEYGTHTEGNNQFTSDGVNWFITWDNTYLYVGLTNYNNFGDAVVLYVDADPLATVNGGSGSDGTLVGTGYDGVTPNFPFRADCFLFVKGDYSDYIRRNGSGGWGANNGNFIGNSNNADRNFNGTTAEFRVTWSAITGGGGRPASFNFLGFLSYSGGGGGNFARVPGLNPGGITATLPYYFTVSSTADATATKPFSRTSFATSINQSLGSANSLWDFTVNGASTTTNLTAMQSVSGILNVAQGTLTTGGNLTLKSTSITNTAMVASVGGTITGNVVVERFIPSGRRAFRILSPGVTTTTTIRENWQENGSGAAGLGTHITGTGGATNGFDATLTNNASLFSFDATSQTFPAITNTNVNTLNADNGYLLFVRGDRTVSLATNTPTATATTLRATGVLTTGTKTYSGLAPVGGAYALVANPYWAPVDWGSGSLVKTNLNSNFWIWNPNLSTRGAYQAASSGYIQPGQAFFVQTVGGTPPYSIQFNEAAKAVSSANLTNTFRTTPQGTITATLFEQNLMTEGRASDIATIQFGKDYAVAVDNDDSTKFTNPDENMSFVRNGKLLSIDACPLPAANETVYLNMSNLLSKNYVLQIDGANFGADAANLEAWLVDNYTNTRTAIDKAGSIKVNYAIDQNPASAAANRFAIEFKNKMSLNLATDELLVNILPNPTVDMVQVNFSATKKGKATLRVVSMEGKAVKSIALGELQNGQYKLSVKDLTPGIYNVEMVIGCEKKTAKLVKQ